MCRETRRARQFVSPAHFGRHRMRSAKLFAPSNCRAPNLRHFCRRPDTRIRQDHERRRAKAASLWASQHACRSATRSAFRLGREPFDPLPTPGCIPGTDAQHRHGQRRSRGQELTWFPSTRAATRVRAKNRETLPTDFCNRAKPEHYLRRRKPRKNAPCLADRNACSFRSTSSGSAPAQMTGSGRLIL